MEEDFEAICLTCEKPYKMSSIDVMLLKDGKINRKCEKCRNEFGRE